MRTLRAFGRAVSRTYTQRVASVNIPASQAHITAWNSSSGDWVYNEAMFVKMDGVMALARKCKSLT